MEEKRIKQTQNNKKQSVNKSNKKQHNSNNKKNNRQNSNNVKKKTIQNTSKDKKVTNNKSLEKQIVQNTSKNKKIIKNTNKMSPNQRKNNDSKILLNIIVFLVLSLVFLLFFIMGSEPKNNSFINISQISEGITINTFKKVKKSDKKVYTKETFKENEPKAQAIPIFTFHRIVPDNVKHEKYEEDQWVASDDMFDKQLKYLYDNGYKTISLDQFYCWYKRKCEFDKKTVVLTLDDGNYDDYYVVLPILKKYNYKATTFVVGSRTTNKDDGKYDPYTRKFITKKMMKTVKKTYPYWDIQSHTYDLHVVEDNGKERVLNLTEEEIKQDFINNKKFGFKYIAYPFGVYNDAIIRQAKENNYNLAFIFRKHRLATRDDNPYEIPRIKINGFSTVEDIKKWLD